MTQISLSTYIKEDWNRVARIRKIKRFWSIRTLVLYLTNEGLMVLLWFRIGSYLMGRRNILLKILFFFVKNIHLMNCRWTGIQITLGTDIGPGLMFNHFGCIVLASTVHVGANCTIFQGVTIGRTWTNTPPPQIGDNCILCPGCKVIGGVKLGQRVIVGANSVVTRDVPNDCVVAGTPAVIISKESHKYIQGSWQSWFPL